MFGWLFPKKYWPDGREMTALEESRHWAVICRGCGYKTDIAALGGVRYRAKGGGKSPRIKCPTCQTITRTRVEWQPPE